MASPMFSSPASEASEVPLPPGRSSQRTSTPVPVLEKGKQKKKVHFTKEGKIDTETKREGKAALQAFSKRYR